MQPGGADPASGSGGFQVAAGPVLRSRPSASLPYSGPACFARGPRFRASRLGSSVLTPSLLPAKCVPVCPGMNTHTPPRACTHTHVHAHTGTRVVWSRSSARIFLLPGTPAGGETTRPAGAGDGPRACRLTGWTWSRLCSTAGRRSGGRTPRAGAPGHTSGSGPRRRRLSSLRWGRTGCCRPGRRWASAARSSPRPAGPPPGTARTASACRLRSWPCTETRARQTSRLAGVLQQQMRGVWGRETGHRHAAAPAGAAAGAGTSWRPAHGTSQTRTSQHTSGTFSGFLFHR